MIQADEGHSSRDPAPSGGNAPEITPRIPVTEYKQMWKLESAITHLTLVERRIYALFNMVDALSKSEQFDCDTKEVFNSICYSLSSIDTLAQEGIDATVTKQ